MSSSNNNNNNNISTITDKYGIVHTFTHCGQMVPIKEIDATEYNHVEFINEYLNGNKPLVIRNALKIFDCGSAFKNWSFEYLEEKCGDNKVYVRRNTIAESYKTGKSYQVQQIEFKSYMKDLHEDNEQCKNSYLAVQNLKKAFMQVSEEIKLPPLVEKFHAGPFLWIARKGHYEFTHIDPDDNLLMVIRGQKAVRLYGCDVYPLKPNELGSKGRSLQSQINCYTNDSIEQGDVLEKFKKVTCSYCLLEEGDLLFFPAFWWHQVTSPQKTISVNVFCGNSGDNNFITKLLASEQRSALLYWLFNIIEQNRPYQSFNRLIANLKASMYCFLFKQWHESLTKEQINEIYNEIVNYFKLDKNILDNEELKTASDKNPPVMKIRGLLWRNDENDQEKD